MAAAFSAAAVRRCCSSRTRRFALPPPGAAVPLPPCGGAPVRRPALPLPGPPSPCARVHLRLPSPRTPTASGALSIVPSGPVARTMMSPAPRQVQPDRRLRGRRGPLPAPLVPLHRAPVPVPLFPEQDREAVKPGGRAGRDSSFDERVPAAGLHGGVAVGLYDRPGRGQPLVPLALRLARRVIVPLHVRQHLAVAFADLPALVCGDLRQPFGGVGVVAGGAVAGQVGVHLRARQRPRGARVIIRRGRRYFGRRPRAGPLVVLQRLDGVGLAVIRQAVGDGAGAVRVTGRPLAAADLQARIPCHRPTGITPPHSQQVPSPASSGSRHLHIRSAITRRRRRLRTEA